MYLICYGICYDGILDGGMNCFANLCSCFWSRNSPKEWCPIHIHDSCGFMNIRQTSFKNKAKNLMEHHLSL